MEVMIFTFGVVGVGLLAAILAGVMAVYSKIE
jgi:hypothetical protein